MEKIKRFINTTLVFFAGNVMSKLVSFFLLPLYTSRLLPEQYGSYDIAISLINVIAPIAFFQIWDAVFRFAFDYEKDDEKQKVINNGTFVFLCGIVFYTLLFFASTTYFKFEYKGYVLIYGLLFALQYVYTFAARVYLKNQLFVVSGVINTLVTSILNIVLILVFECDVSSLYISLIIGTIVQLIIIESSIGVARNFRASQIDKGLISKMLRFSVPLCVATISYWLLSGYTKMIIYEKLGVFANGLYAVANKFASLITILVTVFQYAWNEMAYMMSNEQDRSKTYNICIDAMLKSTLWGTAVICLAIKIVFPYFIDSQYSDALNLIPACMIGVAFNSLASFLGTLFMTEKRTSFILTSTLISSLFNVVLGYIGCKLWGLQGAIIALTASFLLLLILRIVKLVINYNVKIKINNILPLVVLIVSVLFFIYLDSYILFISTVIIVLSGLIYGYHYVKRIFTENRRTKL